MKTHCIKNLSYNDALDLFTSLGEKEICARQIFVWLYGRNILSFDEISVFSKKLRDELADRFSLSALSCVDRKISSDGCAQKFLFRTYDDNYIESVLLRNSPDDSSRITICVSSQIGCAMGCSFCATAKIGFKRNIETAEIIDQLCQIRQITGLQNSNVVFMGMGEPFNNYDNCIKAAEIMNYSFGFHISVRRITISTCGIIPQIRRFFEEKHQFNLAISINDTDPAIRLKSMPVENRYPLSEISELIRSVKPANHGGKITLEYIMRKDNISRTNAESLRTLFGKTNIKINLIPLNPISKTDSIPDKQDMDLFINYCIEYKIPINIRKSLGSEIDGACGQLAGRRTPSP